MTNPTLKTPIDPILYDWIDTIPVNIQQRPQLMDFLMRICHRIYKGINRNSNINPFYKIIELLSQEKLEFWHLQTINEYYNFDIIHHLTNGNIGEKYVGHPCHNEEELRIALSQKNNITNKNTLTNILSNIV